MGLPVEFDERRRMIEEAAYFRAERRGFAGGDPVTDWVQAEAEVDALLSGDGGAWPGDGAASPSAASVAAPSVESVTSPEPLDAAAPGGHDAAEHASPGEAPKPAKKGAAPRQSRRSTKRK